MLTHRIARYAALQGVQLPELALPVQGGLIGSLRLPAMVPLAVTDRARTTLTAAGVTADGLLNAAGDVLVTVQLKGSPGPVPLEPLLGDSPIPEGYALLLTASGFRFILRPANGCFLIVDAVQGRAADPASALLLVARFYLASGVLFDATAVMRQIGAQLYCRRITPGLSREHEGDRSFLLRYRRYLEAVRDYTRQDRPEAPYELVGRAPLRVAIKGERWPAAFTRPRTTIELPTDRGKLRRVDIAGVDDDQAILTADADDLDEDILESGVTRIADASGPLRRMLEALEALADGRHEAYLNLLDVLRRPELLKDLPRSDMRFRRLGSVTAENARQHEAVAMALACPDLCLIHGPPGTGKTTVICELIRQLISTKNRILLVAPTHVALDNVLERIGHEPGIFAIRIGEPDRVDERLLHYLIRRREASLRKQLVDDLGAALKGADPGDAVVRVQHSFRDDIEKAAGIGDMLLLNANLVCATPIGVAMTPAFRDPEPIFDVMIMDESGKATLTELLVPATRAKRWVLVGDHLQLPPYADTDELAAVAHIRAGRSGEDLDNEQVFEAERLRYLAGMLRRQFEERMHPEESRKQKVWRALLDAVFDEENDALEALCRISDDAARWRDMARQHTESGRLPDELADIQLSGLAAFPHRARLLAELLEMREVAMTSAFEFLQHLPPSRSVRLDFQHRMNPELAEFSKRCVYNHKYSSSDRTNQLTMRIPSLEAPSIWIDTAFRPPGERYEHPRDQDWRGGSYFNMLEIEVAVEVIEQCIKWAEQSFRGAEGGPQRPFEIGVLSFYFEQARRLREALAPFIAKAKGESASRWRGHAIRRTAGGAPIELHVSVVDRFQGQEKDVMILSGTRSNPDGVRGHVNNLNRLNVAVTRARYKRIFIGDSSTLAYRGQRPRKDGDLLLELFRSSERKTVWGRRLARPIQGGRP